MIEPIIIVSTWRDGIFIFLDGTVRHEFPGQAAPFVTADGRGGALAIVDGHSLCRRNTEGEWLTIARTEADLSCCVKLGNVIYVGTNDARVLRLADDGTLQPLTGFDITPGREKWYAGSALIDGRRVGPPLGIRSMSATCDGAALLANVHVGGIPRSIDGGITWHPTIDINSDVHQICTHPTRPDLVIAAAAIGLCLSHDGGLTWTVEKDGLHSPYCSAAAFAGDDILVTASASHFDRQGALYRRPVDGRDPFMPVMGLPRWLDGIVDTRCVASIATRKAVVDRGGNLYVSETDNIWSRRADKLPIPSAVVIC